MGYRIIQGFNSSKESYSSNSSYISHTNPLFIQHKLLKIGDLFKLKLLKLYYKLSYNLLPSYFDKYCEIL